MKILVRFKGDNDFGVTMREFGRLLLPRVQREDPLTAEQVAAWFNDSAFTLYEMVQRAGSAAGTPGAPRAYLKIEPSAVYIGAAVDKMLESAHEWSNWDSVLVDGAHYVREPVSLI
jgi:hypothetical protein